MENYSRVPHSPLYHYLYKLCPNNLNNWQILFYEISRQLIFLIRLSSPQSPKRGQWIPLNSPTNHLQNHGTISALVEDITSTAYTATVCLWMFMDSMFCAHTSSLVHLFNRVTIFQMKLCWCCISCTGEVYVALWWNHIATWYSNSWLWSFVWQE